MAKQTQDKVQKEKVRVRILLPVAAKFGLSDDVGKEYDKDPDQATELIESGYAEKV